MKLALAWMTLALPLAITACDMEVTDDDAPAAVAKSSAALTSTSATPSSVSTGKGGHWECLVRSYNPGTNLYTYYAQCVSPYGAYVSASYCPAAMPKCGQPVAF